MSEHENVWRALQYEIEGVILRRLHEERIQGYTLEMAKELTAPYFAFRPDKVTSAVSFSSGVRTLQKED